MRAMLIIAAIALPACATKPPPKWVKAGGDQAEQYACQMDAEKAAVSNDPNALMAAVEKADKRNKVMELCMKSKGWTLQRAM